MSQELDLLNNIDQKINRTHERLDIIDDKVNDNSKDLVYLKTALCGTNGDGLIARVKCLEGLSEKRKKFNFWMLSWIVPTAVSIIIGIKSII